MMEEARGRGRGRDLDVDWPIGDREGFALRFRGLLSRSGVAQYTTEYSTTVYGVRCTIQGIQHHTTDTIEDEIYHVQLEEPTGIHPASPARSGP